MKTFWFLALVALLALAHVRCFDEDLDELDDQELKELHDMDIEEVLRIKNDAAARPTWPFRRRRCQRRRYWRCPAGKK